MWPVLFRIGDLPVQAYGTLHVMAMVTLAVFGAVWFRRDGADGAVAIDAAIAYPYALFVLGRIPYVLMEYGLTREAWRELPNLPGGGFWGGLAILLVCLGAYVLLRRYPFWPALDLFAPPLLLAWGVAKLGCFLGGCCWGGSCEGWPGLTLHPDCPGIDSYPEGPLHPVPLYDAIWAGAGTVLLLLWSRHRPLPGWLFLGFLAWYAGGRFLTEFLRHHYIGGTGILGLYASQLIELGTLAVAIGLMGWLSFTRGKRRVPEVPGRPVRDGGLPAGVQPAGFARRTLAFVMDVALIDAAVTLALVAGVGSPGGLLAVAGLLYVAVQVLPSRTPGMALLGLTWVDSGGRAASVPRRLLRSVLLPVSLATLVGIFRPIASSSRQGLHDMVAGVHVAKAGR